MCDYMGHEFGAAYLDSQCIDGRLWDMDSCDNNGNLYEPMEYIPCPKCKPLEFLERAKDDAEIGYEPDFTGADLWRNAVAKVRRHAGDEATDAALRSIGTVRAAIPGETDDDDMAVEVFKYVRS